jgi:hypothetical protein
MNIAHNINLYICYQKCHKATTMSPTIINKAKATPFSSLKMADRYSSNSSSLINLSNKTSLFNWGCQYSINRPLTFNAAINYRRLESKFFSPDRHTLFFTIKFQERVITFVDTLFGSCSPATVISRVISVVVDSFNRRILGPMKSNMFFVRIAHVIEKILKRVPFAANASAAVVRIRLAAFVFTATNNIGVNFIQPGVCHAVRSVPALFSQAAAALFIFGSNTLTRSLPHNAAVAPKSPFWASIFGGNSGTSKSNKPTKPFSGDVCHKFSANKKTRLLKRVLRPENHSKFRPETENKNDTAMVVVASFLTAPTKAIFTL